VVVGQRLELRCRPCSPIMISMPRSWRTTVQPGLVEAAVRLRGQRRAGAVKAGAELADLVHDLVVPAHLAAPGCGCVDLVAEVAPVLQRVARRPASRSAPRYPALPGCSRRQRSQLRAADRSAILLAEPAAGHVAVGMAQQAMRAATSRRPDRASPTRDSRRSAGPGARSVRCARRRAARLEYGRVGRRVAGKGRLVMTASSVSGINAGVARPARVGRQLRGPERQGDARGPLVQVEPGVEVAVQAPAESAVAVLAQHPVGAEEHAHEQAHHRACAAVGIVTVGAKVTNRDFCTA
jgi:hypothetical protein